MQPASVLGPALRALRTEKTTLYERDGGETTMAEFDATIADMAARYGRAAAA